MDKNPLQRFVGYLRRQSPWLIAALVAILFIPFTAAVLPAFTQWLYGAAPVVPGGPDVSGAQAEAAQQALTVPLGIVLSRLVAAVLFFFVAVGIVWWTMHRITPALPVWAKAAFTKEFDQLPITWKFATYITCWGLLL